MFQSSEAGAGSSGLCPDGGAFAKDQPPRHVDVADHAAAQQLHALLERFGTAQLHAVLHDPLVLAGGLHQLPALEDVVRAGLLDVDILARLARPDGRKRVPVVRRGNADRIDFVIVERAAQVLMS